MMQVSYQKKRRIINKIYIYVLLFVFIYTPNIGSLIQMDTPIPMVSGVIFILSFSFYFLFRTERLVHILSLQRNIKLLLGISIAILYAIIVSLINDHPTRLVQHFSLILQILNGWIIIDILRKNKYTQHQMITLLFNVVLMQAFLCILMIIFPDLKEIALNSYYRGGEENIFISTNRIYGFSGEYTYGTPIFHGIIGVLAFVYGLEYQRKYFYYIPFFLLAILVNGRTGVVIFLVGIGTVVLFYIIKAKKLKRILLYLLVGIVCALTILAIISRSSPSTYNWILSGVDEIINLLFKGEMTGTFSVLSQHWYLPEGSNLIVGEGHRVYSVSGYKHSDIGFVNDLFLGGIIYTSILYGTILRYIIRGINRRYNKITIYSNVNKIMSFTWIPILIVSNFKGECMRSGIILVGIFFIKEILYDTY